MLRLLVLVLALAVGSTAAEAQVFRPKSGAKKAPAAKAAPATAKKQPRTAPPKKRPAKKKNAAAAADEETSAPEPKNAGKDYVKIWDDEEIE